MNVNLLKYVFHYFQDYDINKFAINHYSFDDFGDLVRLNVFNIILIK